MKPTTCIRLVLPPNNIIQSKTASQNTNNLKIGQPIILGQKNLSSVQVINGVPSSIVSSEARFIITSPASTFHLQKSFVTPKTNNLSSVPPVSVTYMNSTLPSLNIATANSNDTKAISSADIKNRYSSINETTIQSSSAKRNSPTCSQTTQQFIKKSGKKIKLEETDGKSEKRRNWTENETNIFIQVWSDSYHRLTRGGTRHTPIYNAMAIELNNMLTDRSLTGGDVKMKIGNLTTEFRKQKKQQGRTGASPCAWPYFDSIDKLLGERPYMDDTLLSDSMQLEQQPTSENTDSSATADLNLTQVSKQADDIIELTTNSDDICIATSADTNNTPGVSDTTSIPDSVSTTEKESKQKKNSCSKKKRVLNPKMELVKELVNQLENANDAAAQSEVKILELLEKQTRLQEISMENEREFLNVFKTFMNNMTANK